MIATTDAGWQEVRKLAAFFRRDLLTALSYRTALVSDWASLVIQIVIFSYVSKMVDASRLPEFGGRRASYLEFVVVGITLTAFMGIAVARLVSAVRQEQVQGTLESVLVTPTHPFTIQLGSVSYDLVYIPLRTLIFIVLSAAVFRMEFHLSGVLPTLAIVAAFVPVVWGLGMAVSAATLTFRRGTAFTGFGMTAITLTSGAYFPLTLFPQWVQTAASANPVAIALRSMREALIGGAAFRDISGDVGVLLLMAAVAVSAGSAAFRLAIERERRLGTLGLY